MGRCKSHVIMFLSDKKTKGRMIVFGKNISLVKQFAKGAPVSVERGGDPSNMSQNDKGQSKTGYAASRQNEIEAVAERLSEAARTHHR